MHFLKRISLKVNVIAWLELELAYYDVAVQQVFPTPIELFISFMELIT